MSSVFDQLLAEVQAVQVELLIDAQNASKKRPYIMCNSNLMCEIPVAFDCTFSHLTMTGATGTALPNAGELIDKGIELGVSSSMCNAIKVACYYLEAGLLTVPDMIITTNSCCDSMDTLGKLMNGYKPWAHIPRFQMDAPHHRDEEAFVYFGKQLRQAVTLMEDVSGRKMDWNRMNEVCVESNKQRQLQLEFQEMKRAVPCPAEPDLARLGSEYTNWIVERVSPKATDWLERLVSATEPRVKAKQGIDGVTEKVRYLWQDLAGSWPEGAVRQRLQKELGAVGVMDYVQFATWTPIDLSSEENMFTSLAKRFLLEDPMNRQALHDVQFYCDDILRIVKDFKCDAVIMAAHVGHHDVNSKLKIVKDMCRDNGIPCLVVGMDIWDKRVVPPDVVYDKIKTFFEITGLIQTK